MMRIIVDDPGNNQYSEDLQDVINRFSMIINTLHSAVQKLEKDSHLKTLKIQELEKALADYLLLDGGNKLEI